jgi:hypothetical protein
VPGHAVFIPTGFFGPATTSSRGGDLFEGLPGNVLGAPVEMVLGVWTLGGEGMCLF